LIKVLPVPLAARVLRWLTSRSQRPAISADQRAALDRATRLRWGREDRGAAWSWGAGPLVLLVHGWNGRAAQMAPLAARLAERGFRCVALDVSGHGESDGQRVDWDGFIEDIPTLAAALNQPVHACVGHSAGGLAMMAARGVHGFRAGRCVCVCSPSQPFSMLRWIRQRLDPPARLLAEHQARIERAFGATRVQLEAGHAFAGAGADLLLVHDRDDAIVDLAESARILHGCPGSRLITTTGLGHVDILDSAELLQGVGEFLQASRSVPAA
jgi:pimeloyl-ACP methyl ester carboxylesterase